MNGILNKEQFKLYIANMAQNKIIKVGFIDRDKSEGDNLFILPTMVKKAVVEEDKECIVLHYGKGMDVKFLVDEKHVWEGVKELGLLFGHDDDPESFYGKAE